MATIIDISYFFEPLFIPQKSDAVVAGNVQALIDQLEPALLNKLLGYELYRNYQTGIAVVPTPDAKWTALRDGKEYTNRSGQVAKFKGLKYQLGSQKKSLIANYVYWNWMQQNASMTTGSGEKTADSQNAVSASPAKKMVDAWNSMVDEVYDVIEFLLSNQTDYPEFLTYYSNGLFYTWQNFTRVRNEILVKQNLLNI